MLDCSAFFFFSFFFLIENEISTQRSILFPFISVFGTKNQDYVHAFFLSSGSARLNLIVHRRQARSAVKHGRTEMPAVCKSIVLTNDLSVP